MKLKEVFIKVRECRDTIESLQSCETNGKLYFQGQLEILRWVYRPMLTQTQETLFMLSTNAFEVAMIAELGV